MAALSGTVLYEGFRLVTAGKGRGEINGVKVSSKRNEE
jgi:hypothetical protein